MNKLLLAFCAVFAIWHSLKAQSYYFSHYQVENGLTNNSVLCSLQDDNGFLWFGTRDGLNRFDGYSFKTFRNEANNATSIGNNAVTALYKDKKGTLYVGTERGLYIYNALTESFTHLKESGQNHIRVIEEDRQGDLWFIGCLTLFKYHRNTKRLEAFVGRGFEATSLCFIDGELWLSAANGILHKYNAQSKRFAAYDIFKNSKPSASRWIQVLHPTKQGTILIGTSNQGVKEFDVQKLQYRDLLTYNSDGTEIFARDFIEQNNKEYWIATESGIYVYNRLSGKTDLMHKQYNNPYSLSDNAVYTFCKDREGGTWIGTYFGGLNYYVKEYSNFEKFFPRVGENSISGNAVREICPDQRGNLWIGTEDGGLNRMAISTGKFTNYPPLGKKGDVCASNIHGLLVKDNLLFAGTFEHGLDIIDLNTNKVIRHCTVNNYPPLKSNFFYCLYQTKNGDIIAGTTRGLYYYLPEQDKFVEITEVPEVFCTAILEDANGTIWVGTMRDGLFYYNKSKHTSGVYRNNPANGTSLSDNNINRLFADEGETLWVATQNGLCKFNNNKNNFTNYTTQNGFPSNVMYTMLEDAQHYLWISTSKGLVQFNPVKQATKVYTKANGLLSDQFNYSSGYKDAQGNMYFGCLKGMIRFNPQQFASSTYQPLVYLTGFQVNHKELPINAGKSPLQRSITHTDAITLNYNQSSFSIDFAALNYSAPQMTSYAYKMVGLDRDWTYLSINRKAYFTKLAPGKYIFKVKATNNSGLWNGKDKRLVIIINPPFWQSKLAYLIYMIVAGGMVYVLIRRYHNKLEQINRRKFELLQNEKEKEVYNAKIAFFTHIAHEIRTPLTLIKGPMEKVIKQVEVIPDMRKNLKTMERNTDRLLNLTSQLLDFRKTETQGFSLNFVKTNVITLLQQNYMVFEAAAEQKALRINLHVPAQQFYAYVDIEAIHKILNNLLSNAVKYAVEVVHVELLINADSTFSIIIKNDGYLIPAEMKEKVFEPFFRIKDIEKMTSGTGIGLSLARSLAELHSGTIELDSGDEYLNAFVLTLPVHHEIEFNLN